MIKIDIDMPNNCDECRFTTEYGYCKAMPDNFCGNTDDRKRPEWCPLKEQPEIVLCNDCKYGVKSPTFRYYPKVTWCNKHSTSHNDEWFCADGERREQQ